MKNMKKKVLGSGSGSTLEPDPDPLFPNVDPRIRIRIHYYGKVDPRIRIRIHFPQCGSQDPDPDPRQNEMDPKRCST